MYTRSKVYRGTELDCVEKLMHKRDVSWNYIYYLREWRKNRITDICDFCERIEKERARARKVRRLSKCSISIWVSKLE